MIKILYFLTIFSAINLSSLYFVDQKITFVRIFGILLLLIFFIENKIIKRTKLDIPESTIKIFKWAVILICYRLLIDLTFHFENFIDPVNTFLKQMLCVLLFIVYEQISLKSGKNQIEKIIIICSAIPVVMGIIQIHDSSFVLSNIINIPLVGFNVGEGGTFEYLSRTNRIVGTYSIAIGFVLLIGYLFCFSAFELLKKKRVKPVLLLLVLTILLLNTQTRSGIYGILPSLFISFIFVSKRSLNLKKIGQYLLMIILIFISFTIVQNKLNQIFHRTKIEIDINTATKLSSNIYSCYTVLVKSPLIGIPPSQQRKAVSYGYQKLGRLFSAPYEIVVTHHNLFARYLRYYGIIGLSLLIILIKKMTEKIRYQGDIYTRYKLFAVIIFFFLYSLLHNNELLISPLIWIILAMGAGKNPILIKEKA